MKEKPLPLNSTVELVFHYNRNLDPRALLLTEGEKSFGEP